MSLSEFTQELSFSLIEDCKKRPNHIANQDDL